MLIKSVGQNPKSMTYRRFLDSIRIIYAQVADCSYDTYVTLNLYLTASRQCLYAIVFYIYLQI